MDKSEYFKELEYRLRGLPERERENIIAVYEELFQKAIQNGKSEAEIADSLGFPRVPNWEAIGSAPGASVAHKGPRGAGAGRDTGAAGQSGGAGPGPAAPGPSAGGVRYDSAGTETGGTGMPYDSTAEGAGGAGVRHDSTAAGAGGAGIRHDSTAAGVGGGVRPDARGQRPAPAGPLPGAISGFVPPLPLRGPAFAPPPPPYRAPVSTGCKSCIAALALGFFNLVVVLGPFIGLCGALFGLWAAAAVLLLSPLLAVVGMGFPHDSAALPLMAFGSLAGFGLGLMMLVVLQLLTKGFFKLIYKYLRFNWNIIRGIS